MNRQSGALPRFLAICTCLCMLGPIQSIAGQPEMPTELKQVFTSLKPGPHWSLWVKDLTLDQPLYSRRAHDFFIPASTLKLVTATSALVRLGPDFSFKTRLGIQGVVKKHILHGSVRLEMRGDPTLTTDDLRDLFFTLKQKGIDRITGNVTVDASRFTGMPYAPGWMWDELTYPYAVPISAMMLDGNRFVMHVRAGNQKKAHIDLALPRSIIHITNQLKLTKRYERWCPLTFYSTSNNHYTVSGCLRRGSGDHVRVLAIRNPWPYVKEKIKGILKDEGMIVHSITQKINPKKGVHWVVSHDSSPLSELVVTMLKESNNQIADTLFLEMGKEFKPNAPTWEAGSLAVKDFLHRAIGINTQSLRIVDGSGLSRYNLIRASQMAQLLTYIDRKRKINGWIDISLPILGVDGTLSHRLKKNKRNYFLKAKTGSMTGVSALAGYLLTPDAHRLAFVMIMNGTSHKIKRWRRVENNVMRILLKGD